MAKGGILPVAEIGILYLTIYSLTIFLEKRWFCGEKESIFQCYSGL